MIVNISKGYVELIIVNYNLEISVFISQKVILKGEKIHFYFLQEGR